MTPTTRNTLISILAVIILAALGYFAWKERSIVVPGNQNGAASSSTSGISTTVSASSSIQGSGYTITPISVPKGPDYTKPLSYTSITSADEKTRIQADFAAVQTTLSSNPIDFNAWIELGNLRKETGDYAGAVADWNYMSQLYPTNKVSFANLADLYTNFSPNYPKAAAAYKQAIKNDPKQPYLYMDLFNLYVNKYPQSVATTEAVLQQGIAANPDAADLKAALQQYQAAHQ